MKKYQSFLSEFFQFLEVKFSIYLNRRVFVMHSCYVIRVFGIHRKELCLRAVKTMIGLRMKGCSKIFRWAHMSEGTFSDDAANKSCYM